MSAAAPEPRYQAGPQASIRAAYSKHILHEHLLKKLNQASPEHFDHLPKAPELPENAKNSPYEGRVCIIGAGVSGLFIALMLKFLKIDNFKILEGNTRTGGRLYTYDFPEVEGAPCPHNYYDIGAMRIPDIQWMQPTLELMKFLGVKREPYIYNNDYVPACYWYRPQKISDPKFDAIMEPIVESFTNNFNIAFRKWLGTDNDNYSTRGFLMSAPPSSGGPDVPWTYDETAKAELYDTSTGLFDQSFTDIVIDYADFQGASQDNWWRIEGGGQRIADAMVTKLLDEEWPTALEGEPPYEAPAISVTTNAKVVALSHDKITKKMSVTVADQESEEYDMVFNTTAMAPLQQMDLEGLELPDQILTGIRSLSYDRAAKVAIKFSVPWWNVIYEGNGKWPIGGASGSDLPIRSVVYPSWFDGQETPAVLMVSYSWAQDATRMAALIPDYDLVSPEKNDPIVKLCLQNLVKLWAGSPYLKPSYEFLASKYVAHHAYAWQNDPWTGGAYALFGPAQFKNVYPDFYPLFCEGQFAMCGEALSSHHAWISGALDSAYVKMYQFLHQNNLQAEIKKLNDAIFGGGEGGHPEEMDLELVKWSVLLGEGGGPKGWGKELNLKKGKKEKAGAEAKWNAFSSR